MYVMKQDPGRIASAMNGGAHMAQGLITSPNKANVIAIVC